MAVELKVGFHVHDALHVSDRKEVSELRPDAEDTRVDGTENGSGPAVRRQLRIYVADGADEYLLGQKLRRRHVQMKVDAVLVVGGWI